MPIVSWDMVVRCKACEVTARVRCPVDSSGELKAPSLGNVVKQLTEQGFDFVENDYVCWNHGGGGSDAVKPKPSLMKERS